MDETRVVFKTSLGDFTIALDGEKAPKTVENFLAYVDADHYAGTVFHRVIDGFMVQGGGYDRTDDKKAVRSPVQNEADNGVKNTKGTVAMARTNDPHSATSQFFVNVSDNAFLDHKSKSGPEWGYTVFGRVVDGMDTVDKMKAVKTGARGAFAKDAPLEPIEILEAKRA